MQIPLSYAEDIIGIRGTNIEYIRRASGAILTVQESRVPDEIIVEIKGTSSQVQMAQQLIQVGESRKPCHLEKGNYQTMFSGFARSIQLTLAYCTTTRSILNFRSLKS